jgi:hypothetical protein
MNDTFGNNTRSREHIESLELELGATDSIFVVLSDVQIDKPWVRVELFMLARSLLC